MITICKKYVPSFMNGNANSLISVIMDHSTVINKRETILRELSNIGFPQLKIILAESNAIESIEGLHQIRMPAL